MKIKKNPTQKKPSAALLKHLNRALPIAQQAALEAGAFLKQKFGKFRQLEKKKDSTLVTEADRGAEKIVVRLLRKHFPQDHIIGEEGGENIGKSTSPFRWHIDPLDGTTNFVHAFPLFCVSIGLEYEERDLILGAIYQPIYNNIYTAIQSKGAHWNGKRIFVSKTDKITDALLTTGFSYQRDLFLAQELQSFAHIIRESRALRRTGSAALDLTYVATGQFDGFWERGLSSWDVAAGIALLTEAGGCVSQADGNKFKLGDQSILASNGLIHKSLIKALN